MRIPFDSKYRDKIESGEYKVVTRDGKPVRIICWDMDSYNHIVALVANYPNYNGSLSEHIFSYGMDGRYSATAENAEDLFIVTPEPEMTEFEKEVHAFIDEQIEEARGLKEIAAELLDFAKQQLIQSGELMTQEHHEKLMETLNKAHEEELEKAYKNADEVQYRKGREDALKGLPRWRNVEADKRYVGCVTRYMDVNGDWNYCMSSGKLSDDCQYISIAALEKLPQEDESHE